MNSKTFLIAFTIIVALISITAGTVLGLRARRARTTPPTESSQTAAPPPLDDSYLPSRAYVEGRAKAFKQLREKTLKAQFSDTNSNTRK